MSRTSRGKCPSPEVILVDKASKQKGILIVVGWKALVPLFGRTRRDRVISCFAFGKFERIQYLLTSLLALDTPPGGVLDGNVKCESWCQRRTVVPCTVLT